MSADSLSNVKVGDTLILLGRRGVEQVTVSRIGRTYLYVALSGRERRERYDRHTGLEDGTIARRQLYTPEEYDATRQRTALVKQLRDAGIEIRHEYRSELPTAKLQALLAVVSDAPAEK